MCEIPSGGFKASPDSVDPYILMGDIYLGIKCLRIVGEGIRSPSQTLDLIAKFQNEDGGFRRSIFLGISSFESTYHAISATSTIMVGSE